MFKQLLKQAIRNLIKQRKNTLINIAGLVVAICSIYIISVWVIQEYSYDKHHSKADRIYRLSVEAGSKGESNHWHFARTWQKWRRELPRFFPEVEELAELAPTFNTILEIDEHTFYERGFAVKPEVFNVFDFNFIQGNAETVLKDKHTIVISETLAEKYFNSIKPIGQTIKLDGSYIDKDKPYTITGVFRDIPITSHFHTNFLVHYTEPTGMNKMEWAYTYILLKQEADITSIQDKITEFVDIHLPQDQKDLLIAVNFTPLLDIHLKSHIEREIELNGDIRHVKLFSYVCLGLFILALINFINLISVSFGKRLLSFSMNRIVGGRNYYNLIILIVESGIVTLIAIVLALALFNPIISILSNNGLVVNIEQELIFLSLLKLSVMLFIIITLAGLIPYSFTNVRNPSRNKCASYNIIRKKAGYYNSSLLVLQFAISILVIIASLMLNRQNKFMFNKNMGRNEKVVVLYRNFGAEDGKMLLIKETLEKNPNVPEFCGAMQVPSSLIKDARQIKSSAIQGGFTDYPLTIFPTDRTFFELFNIPLVAGRSMKPYTEGQKFEEYILNESAVKRLGLESPEEILEADFTIKPYFDGIIHGGKVVGVVKDFNFTSLYHPIQPMVFFQKPIWHSEMLLKLDEGNLAEQLKSIQKDWDDIFPGYPMDYKLLSDIYDEAYQKDIAVNKILNLFSILCIVVSVVGLFGVSTVLLSNKTKEIGIRKVNGAKIYEVLAMLNMEYVKWVFIAFIIACPIAWYIINKWLQNFAFRTNISWWIFVLAGCIALGIALLTVSWQSWRAASRNPVESLRYE